MSRRRGAAQRGYGEREEQKKYRRGKKTRAGGEKGGPRERGGTAGGVSSGIWILKLLKQRRVGRTAARAAGRRRTAGARRAAPCPGAAEKMPGTKKGRRALHASPCPGLFRGGPPPAGTRPPSRSIPRGLRALPRAPALCARACRPLKQKATCFSRPHLPSPPPGGPSPAVPRALPRLPHGPMPPYAAFPAAYIPPSCSMSASTPTAWLQFSPAGIRTRAARYTVERCW